MCDQIHELWLLPGGHRRQARELLWNVLGIHFVELLGGRAPNCSSISFITITLTQQTA